GEIVPASQRGQQIGDPLTLALRVLQVDVDVEALVAGACHAKSSLSFNGRWHLACGLAAEASPPARSCGKGAAGSSFPPSEALSGNPATYRTLALGGGFPLDALS